ncbi:MAG: hypothetical protein ACYC1D_14605 [Acidimicrobiales bacterium]
MTSLPSWPISAGGLLGGYAVGRASGKRPLGGALAAAAGLWCASRWRREAGVGTAAVLGIAYVGALGASHPLSKKIGPWRAVLTASAASSALSWAFADRRSGRRSV